MSAINWAIWCAVGLLGFLGGIKIIIAGNMNDSDIKIKELILMMLGCVWLAIKSWSLGNPTITLPQFILFFIDNGYLLAISLIALRICHMIMDGIKTTDKREKREKFVKLGIGVISIAYIFYFYISM